MSGQAHEAAGRMGASVSDAAGQAVDYLNREVERLIKASALVREQPLRGFGIDRGGLPHNRYFTRPPLNVRP